MKHLIIVKWIDKPEDTEKEMEKISTIFEKTLSIPGVNSFRLIRGIQSAANRFDIVIAMDMTSSALELYNASPAHAEWKEKYGPNIEKKAIFDFEGEI